MKVCLLHALVTVVANLKEMHYKGWIYLHKTKVCELLHECKCLSFKNVSFKMHIKIEYQGKIVLINP
jgi:hypothetical protein